VHSRALSCPLSFKRGYLRSSTLRKSPLSRDFHFMNASSCSFQQNPLISSCCLFSKAALDLGCPKSQNIDGAVPFLTLFRPNVHNQESHDPSGASGLTPISSSLQRRNLLHMQVCNSTTSHRPAPERNTSHPPQS
jgi:hypothetical protein